jgi:CBS domain-containing protein
MRVKEILQTKKRRGEILNVAPDAAVPEIVAVMVKNDTGSVVVFDETRRMRGMVTFREVLCALHERGANALATLTAADIMEEDCGYAAPDDGVDQVRNLMTSRHIRYLPVMDEGKLTDIISFYDVARAAAKQADFENRMLKQYIRNWPEEEEE